MDFDLLKAHAIKKSKEFLYSHPEYRLSLWEHLKLKYFLFLRQKGYSVAAITGHKEFYGLDFFVNKHTLIPRPDTELMVAEVINEINNCHAELVSASTGTTTKILKQVQDDKIVLIDVGTGSGCIPISIACHAEFISASPKIPKQVRNDMQIFATDISKQALKVAKKNASKHNVNIKFFRGNLLQPINKLTIKQLNNSNIIITANLPYLTEQQFQDEPSIQREPKNALVAKNNGLALYEELLQQIIKFKIYNLKFIIFLEIDPSQAEEISKLIKQYLPDSSVETKKDLAGRDRLVVVSILSC